MSEIKQNTFMAGKYSSYGAKPFIQATSSIPTLLTTSTAPKTSKPSSNDELQFLHKSQEMVFKFEKG